MAVSINFHLVAPTPSTACSFIYYISQEPSQAKTKNYGFLFAGFTVFRFLQQWTITLKMADQKWSDIYVVFTKILCGRNFCVWQVTKLKFTGRLQMVSLSLYPQFETNLMSNSKVIELLLQLKSAKAHGKKYIKVKPYLVRHVLRNRLFLFFR